MENEGTWSDVNKAISSEQSADDPIAAWKKERALDIAVNETLDDLNHPGAKAERTAWQSVSGGIGQEQPQEYTIDKDGNWILKK